MKKADNILVGVVGVGTMGAGIAQVIAAAGHQVFLYDEYPNARTRARNTINSSLESFVVKGKITSEEAFEIFDRTRFVDSISELRNCNFIIEAIVEDLKAKQYLFEELEHHISEDTILATNTSSLSVTEISSLCKKPGRVIGAHFFNPAPLMPLVEIVRGLLTSEQSVREAKELIDGWGKTTVVCKDSPGFIVNRVSLPYYGEALRMLEENIADVQTIDEAMKIVGNFRMGPFETIDLIGNDVNYKVNEEIFQQFKYDKRFKPSPIQKKLIDEGKLGRKSGEGFYVYPRTDTELISKDENLSIEIFFRILSVLINEAAAVVYSKVATVHDIDLAMLKD
jgi:3-hydroxybutyryl-CoA dehydrogenase